MSVEGARRDAPGVLAPDRARSVVAISDGGELGVALRDVLPREFVVVRDVRPAECADAVAACKPWPWMVCGSVPALPHGATVALQRHPALVLWLGASPGCLPAHAQSCSSFHELVPAVNGALRATVGGMRLGPGLGVVMPDGACVRSAALEALVAQHPRGFSLPLQRFRAASSSLRRHHMAFTAGRDAAGRVRLVPA